MRYSRPILCVDPKHHLPLTANFAPPPAEIQLKGDVVSKKTKYRKLKQQIQE